MNPVTKAYFQLHVAVFLFGFTAILGRFIQVGELPTVWWRLLITCLSLLLLPGVVKALREMPRSLIIRLAGIGVVVTSHWICFFGAVNYSNVSVTLGVLATTSFFTAFIEPLVKKTRIKWYEVALGILVVPGMYMIFRFTNEGYTLGILMALASAFLGALFSSLNTQVVNRSSPMAITFVELGSGWVFIGLIAPFYGKVFGHSSFVPSLPDLGYLAILGLVCTTFAYVLALNCLKHISAFTSNLTINLEPVYGIILAWLIFQENKEVGSGFYVGVGIILLAIFLHPLIKRMVNSKKQIPNSNRY